MSASPSRSEDTAPRTGATGVRDTDADWRLIGADQPYWGVLTSPNHRTEALTPATLDRFYQTGRDEVALHAHLIAQASGAPPAGGRAIDFGCGVGRLSEAMADIADEVTGVDVSPGMLEAARRRSGRVTYVHDIPVGPFDWINSAIVFQHIPPPRGLAILDRLLSGLAMGGAVSIQLPFARADWRLEAQREQAAGEPPPGVMTMHDYDLNAVLRRLWERGVRRHVLSPTDHDGVYGFIIAGRREPFA